MIRICHKKKKQKKQKIIHYLIIILCTAYYLNQLKTFSLPLRNVIHHSGRFQPENGLLFFLNNLNKKHMFHFILVMVLISD